MVKQYVSLAARVLRKYRLYSAINVLGLAVGIACCVLISIWAREELAFDGFHENADRIYRINKVYTPTTGGRELHALTPGPMAGALLDEFPEIETATRILPSWGGMLLVNGETSVASQDVLFVDQSFADVFSFQMVRGDRSSALTTPASIVLTTSMAQALFGDEDPMGSVVVGGGDFDYTVTGIIEDTPDNSHLRYNALVSWSTIESTADLLNYSFLERWLPQTIYTYVMLRDGTSAGAVDAKLPDFTATHLASRADQYSFYLQPLSDVYLQSRDVLYQRSMVQGSGQSVRALGLVAFLILLIACVNFTNLTTAQATRRAREIGVRKSLGAHRRQLVTQFLAEAFALAGLAAIVSTVLLEASRPLFNALTGKEAAAFFWVRPDILLSLAAVWVLAGFLGGLYPAVVLSRLQPARAIKNVTRTKRRGGLQTSLVTAQFAAAIVLIIASATVIRQMDFVQRTDPGFDREHVVVLPVGRTGIPNQLDAFKAELLESPGILAAAATSDVPGTSLSSYSVLPEGRSADEGIISDAVFLADTDLLNAYGMQMASGRFFDPNRPADSSAIVVNEAMVRSLGWTDAVGKRFDRVGEDHQGTIIGVVKDYHQASVHQEVAPIFFALERRIGALSVRVADSDVSAALGAMRTAWERFEPRYPFEYSFLDDDFAALYELDRRLMKTLSFFAILAVLVACLGLFGLAAFAAEQRTKEIGIRKVLGASATSVVTLLSRDYIRLVLVAFVIAAPLGFLIAQRWLDGFAYRINVGPGTLVIAGIAVLVTALLTVSTQAIRAAHNDPVKSLRYE